MTKTSSFLAAITLLSVAHLACNPDCQSIQGVGVSTDKNYNDYQILITANPASSLEGRKVFIGGILAESEFVPDKGLKVTIPGKDKLDAGKQELRIEDPDCLDVFVLDNFEIVPEGYFDNLSTFSPPLPPEIVIPNIPIAFPSSIDNAWLSPENPGYCLWFTMYKEVKVDANGDTISITPTKLIDPNDSFEQATCWCLRDFSVSGLPYAQNRMSGVIDTASNLIEIYIDRSQTTGEVEEFIGEFIDIDETPYASDRGYVDCPDMNCANTPQELNDPPTTGHLMLLTSKKTGKQLVAFQLK